MKPFVLSDGGTISWHSRIGIFYKKEEMAALFTLDIGRRMFDRARTLVIEKRMTWLEHPEGRVEISHQDLEHLIHMVLEFCSANGWPLYLEIET